jgi:phage terminase Nu1 subunit (DNA packaging protein)
MSIFSLPSIWNLIISTIAFSIAAKYIHSHFHRRGIPVGQKRNLWVLGLASLLSWGAGDAADWTHDKLVREPPAVQAAVEVSQLAKTVDQIHK